MKAEAKPKTLADLVHEHIDLAEKRSSVMAAAKQMVDDHIARMNENADEIIQLIESQVGPDNTEWPVMINGYAITVYRDNGIEQRLRLKIHRPVHLQ